MHQTLSSRKEMPGLNTLRFFAALMVFIGHLELVKYYLGLNNQYALFERINFGGIGVYFFFVLSGFLITWLLLEEKKRNNTIGIGAFYMRRILRIWPLYYLILVIGFFILPAFSFFELFPGGFSENFNLDLFLYLIVLPNLAFSFAPPVPHIGQAWSIGVEEQFYLLWPLFVKYSKNVGRTIRLLLIAYVSLKGVIWILAGTSASPELQVFKRYLAMSKFECMMIGGGVAWLVWKENKLMMKLFFNKWTLALSLLSFPILSYIVHPFPFIQDIIHLPLSVCFAIIIVNIGRNPDSFIKLNWKFTGYLGTISYGFYMYHLLILFAVTKLFSPYYSSGQWWTDVVVIILSFLLTFIVSMLSYEFFEKKFIKLKERFNKLKSV